MNFELKIIPIALFILSVLFLVLSIFSKPKSQTTQTFSSPAPSVLGISTQGEMAQVVRVIDGDTIEVNLNGVDKKVRYVGMDTPETVDPNRPVGCYGKEASNENKKLLEGKEVRLTKDVSDVDKFDRLLRYVYVGSLFVNDYLVRQGFARVYTIPPDVAYSTQFTQAQSEAQAKGLGLWKSCR